MKAVGLVATPCPKSLGSGSGGHKQQTRGEGRKACSTFSTVYWSEMLKDHGFCPTRCFVRLHIFTTSRHYKKEGLMSKHLEHLHLVF